MYGSFLTKVITGVNQINTPTGSEKMDVLFNQMFNPQAYAEYAEKQQKKEELGRKIIAGAVVVSVIGETINLVKQTGIVDKVLKR